MDQRAGSAGVLSAPSTGFTVRSEGSLPKAFTARVDIATRSAMTRVAAVWGCMPMIVTLRNEVANAIPAQAADALVDLMSVLQK
jgi:hypothetical protein